MPHIIIKHFDADISKKTKDEIQKEITSVISEKLKVNEGFISISMVPIHPKSWNSLVYKTDIENDRRYLVKYPDY